MGTKSTNANSRSADHLSPEERSALMSKIGPKDTKPEQLTRSMLHRAGYRFRKNVTDLPGRPDAVLPKYDTVVFVHGCYWHRHDCRKGRSVPTKNREFWVEKFERNVERDAENERALREQEWNVLTVWSCELKDDPDAVLERLDRALQDQVAA